MKSFLKYSAIALAMGLAQQASAVDIVITGSTAFRGPTHTAITNLMGGSANCRRIHSHASTLNSANQATFKGNITGITGTVYVYCSWSGSATGVIAVANSTPVSAISATLVDAVALGSTTAATSPDTTKIAKMAFSDVYKESTSAANAALNDSTPAVIPFRFVRNRDSSSGITNVTAQQVRALWVSGTQDLALFTGVPTDTKKVIAVGRDNGSGTRITGLAETKYGIGNLVTQWNITTTGANGAGTVTTAQVWPVGLGVGSADAGNGGYSSGGDIANLMTMSSASVNRLDENGDAIDGPIPVDILGWLGLSDTSNATATNGTGGATALTYEGVPYSANAVYEGAYTLWGYLHLYYGSLTGDETVFRTGINTQFAGSALGGNGLFIANMKVQRLADGGLVGR
jgi:hypothetical protein